MPRIIIGVGVALLVFAGAHVYLWHRLFRSTTARSTTARSTTARSTTARGKTARGSRVRWLGAIAVALLGLAMVFAVSGLVRVISWVGYLWMALFLYLFLALLILEVPRLVLSRRASVRADESRRLLLARSTAIMAGLTSVAITGYGASRAFGRPVIRRVPIALPRLARPLDGYRIALISDVHLGPYLHRQHVRRLVNMINNLDADLVAITGDLADGSVADLGSSAEPLRDLRATDGTFFVTGNHEYYTGDLANWLDALRGWGVRPLRNGRAEITRGTGALDVAGVNDPQGERVDDGPDFDLALGGRDPDRPVVLLSHQPVQVHQARAHGVDLQLSGHTHGGQLCPVNFVVPLQQPALAGRYRFGGTQLFVTRGAGFWGPPVRVLADPEVALIELRA